MTTVFTFGAFLACLAAAGELAVEDSLPGLSLTMLVAAIAAAYAIGAGISRLLLDRLDSHQVLGGAVAASTLIGPLMLVADVLDDGPLLLQPLCVGYGLLAGIILPNASMLAMRDLPNVSAMAAALLGGAKMLAAAAASAVLVGLSSNTATALGALICIFAAAALLGLHYPANSRAES